MNYIELINMFWLANEEHSFSTTEIALYFYLLKVNNSCSWRESFKRNNSKIESDLGISFNTLKNARNRLKQADLIEFRTVNGVSNVTYWIKTLSKFDEVNSEVTDEVANEVNNEVLSSKYKLNKTKRIKPPVPPPGEPPKPASDFIDLIIHEFTDSYFVCRKVQYEVVNPGKERKAAGKILKLHKKKFPGYSSEQSLKALRTYFDACNKVEDTWLKDNMSLSIIIDKFNEINNKLRNGNKRTKNGNGATPEQLAEITARHFASDRK